MLQQLPKVDEGEALRRAMEQLSPRKPDIDQSVREMIARFGGASIIKEVLAQLEKSAAEADHKNKSAQQDLQSARAVASQEKAQS